MSKQTLLLVDGDTRSLRVLEVSLRKAGFTVTPAVSVKDALDKLEIHTPDLIISETKFPADPDGFELRRRLRAAPDWAEIPFVFLTTETAIENKIRGLELGVEDYLTKPIYIKEIVTRINILLQKKQRAGFDERKDGVRFAGRVADMPVVDVIQTIEVSRKSGVINFVGMNGRTAAIYFRDGKVIDAEAGTLLAEDAVYRLLTWSDGEFEVVFRTVRRREAIVTSSQGLLMEGMRRLDEWSRLLEQLPPLNHRFEIDVAELSTRLGDVPDDNNKILRMIDGKRTLLEVIDASDFGDLECLQAISRLYFEDMLVDLDPDERPRRDTGKPVPLVVIEEAPTPIEEVASGPIDIADLARRAGEVGPSEIAPVAQVVAPIEEHIAAESTQQIAETEVISEESAPPGPLLGGYRPSSLRLIDEAVAAAQAIEPSLFEPEELAASEVRMEPPPTPSMPEPIPLTTMKLGDQDLVEVHDGQSSPPPLPVNGSNGSGRVAAQIAAMEDMSDDAEPYVSNPALAIPTVIDADEPSPPLPYDERPLRPGEDSGELPLRRFAATIRREDSGLRMIGSAGRDRAEASGEVRLPTPRATTAEENMRELITILPRRKTGEQPVVVPDELGGDTDREAVSEAKAAAAPAAKPVESPRLPPPRVTSVEGGVVSSRRGPGPLAIGLFVLASAIASATAYVQCHKRNTRNIASIPPTQEPIHMTPGSAEGSSESVAPIEVRDAAVAVVAEPVDAKPAKQKPIDAAAAVVETPRPPPVDAAPAVVETPRPPPVDAAPAVVETPRQPPVDAAPAGPATLSTAERNRQAKAMLDQAHAALEDGDPDKALELADESLKLRVTQATLLEKARALQRLSRIDEAVAATDQALEIGNKNATVWEQRALILWSARRYDDAKAAMQKYLELSPDGKSAASFKHLIESK